MYVRVQNLLINTEFVVRFKIAKLGISPIASALSNALYIYYSDGTKDIISENADVNVFALLDEITEAVRSNRA